MKKTLKEILLERLPKKYHDRVDDIIRVDDFVDVCKYVLFYTHSYTVGECLGSCYPVRSISEAIEFIKHSLFSVDN